MVSLAGALRRVRGVLYAPLSPAAFRRHADAWRDRFERRLDLQSARASAFIEAGPHPEGVVFHADGRLRADRDQPTAVFSEIYDTGMWGGGSGGGSALTRSVAMYTGFLEAFIRQKNVRSVVDVGCGDWQFSRYLNLDGVDYLGLDAAQSVVEANAAVYGRPGVRFECVDATRGIPQCDLVISKDVLQHLSNNTVEAILASISTNSRHAIVTNDYSPENVDCSNGDTRPLDITRPPFSIPARAMMAFDGKVTFVTGI